jgi:hypothetical protein
VRAADAVVVATLACAAPAYAGVSTCAAAFASPLSLARVEGGDVPRLLAQRAIEREWPAPGDSGVPMIPHGRSALGALIFSAAVPGSGQVYAGRTWSGLSYAAAEVAGWFTWRALRRRADDLRDDARGFAGSPNDTTSAWSFVRWEQATEGDDASLRALYSNDRDAFDQAIASDPRYAAGWAAPADRARFSDLRRQSDRRLSQSRGAEGVLWLNHVVSALDALRATRIHNAGLGHGLELKAKGGWRRGRPEMVLALQRRF